MRDDIAELVHTVFRTGFDLKEQLVRGDAVDNDKARRDLLNSLNDARLTESSPNDRGIRYALACWLDEILTKDSPWAQWWGNNSLEFELSKTNLRATLFWEPGVTQAEARPGSDALEVYYLCVLFGFRGDYHDRPEQLGAMAERMKNRVIQSYGEEPPQPDKSTPRTDVPLLHGREKFQMMLKFWGGAFLFLAFALGYLLISKFGGGGR